MIEYRRIDEGAEGQRIDNYLLKITKGVPKSRIYRALRKGEVRVNKSRVKPTYKLEVGDEVRVPPLQQTAKAEVKLLKPDTADWINTSILYESESLLVINKPAGLPVHGGSELSGGLIEYLRLMRPRAKFLELVHRLDRATSGCILVAKKRQTLIDLQNQMRAHKVEKFYEAICFGEMKKKQQLMDWKLHKLASNKGLRQVVVSKQGKCAQTIVKRLSVYNGMTRVACQLLTGRTHQIRVHLSHSHLPIIGDPRYGHFDQNRLLARRGIKRMLLHAKCLICFVDGQMQRFEAPIPCVFDTLVPIGK